MAGRPLVALLHLLGALSVAGCHDFSLFDTLDAATGNPDLAAPSPDLASDGATTPSDLAASDRLPISFDAAPDVAMPDLTIIDLAMPDLSSPDLAMPLARPDLAAAMPDLVCVPESNTAFCQRLQKTCGGVTAPDNCGKSRTVPCGTCANPTPACVNGACQPCAADADCTFSSPICSNGRCVGCGSSMDCSRAGWGDTCGFTGGCGCFNGNAGCTNPRVSLCDPKTFLCACGNTGGPCPLGQTCVGGGANGTCQ